MHEQGLVALEARRLLADHAGTAPAAVEIVVGPDIDREVVAAAWARVVAGTALERTEVNWMTGRHGLTCFQCGTRYEGGPLDRCPSCDGSGLVTEPAPEVVVRIPSDDHQLEGTT